jgi:hypothetical protein
MISAESVAEIFKTQNIASIAIIDDAFNAASSISPGEAQSLYEQFSVVPEIEQAFQELALPLEGGESLTAEAIAKLGAAIGSPGALAALELLKVGSRSRRERLRQLAGNLRKLGVSVTSIAAEKATKAKKSIVADDVNVVLLDYDLGDASTGAGLSRGIAKRIYEQFRNAERPPLVILMSSQALAEKDVAAFQKGTKVLSGMFYFVPKDDLFDEERRNYRLAAFARSLITGQTLQVFVSKVEAALDEAREKVFDDVRSLSISDFTYLKMLRLHEDGEPLGEYLMWLMSAHLLNYVLSADDVHDSETKLNALTFDHLPPTQAEPSPNLAMLYSSAVMRDMPELPADKKQQSGSLQFGDLFRAKDKVWLCITATCDLAFGPTRPLRSKRSVLLIPGKLVPIETELTPFERRMPRTELVWLDKKVFRILWDTKEVARSDWGDIHKWQKGKEAKRIARLHAPFALEIQRLFTADLSRIGMPVPPPLYSPVMIKLTCLDEHGAELELTGEGSRAALSVGGERGEMLIMGEGFMNDLPSMLVEAAKALEARRIALAKLEDKAGPAPAAEAKFAIEKLEAVGKDATLLSEVRGPFKKPQSGASETIVDGAILLADESEGGAAKSWPPLRLTVVAPPVIEDSKKDAAA